MKRLFALLICLTLLAGILIACKGDPADLTYDQLIAKYTEVLTAAKEGTAVSDMKRTGHSTLGEDVVNAIYDTVESCEDLQKMGYGTKDLDGDGIEELLLMRRDCTPYALFTQHKGRIILLIYFNDGGGISQDGLIYNTYHDTDTQVSMVKALQNGQLVGPEFGISGGGENIQYFRVENGERITIEKDEYFNMDQLYFGSDYLASDSGRSMTSFAGFRFIGVFDTPPDGTAPAVDFSDYAAVLDTYKKIIEASPDFTSTACRQGQYDNLFSYSSSADFNTARRLIYACIICRLTATDDSNKAFGYTEKDLNGDGVTELILMTEAYEILAVFAMQEQSPTLLYAADGFNECLITPDNRLRIEQYSYYRDGGELALLTITDKGTLQTDAFLGSVSSGYTTYFYTMVNGLRQVITREEAQVITQTLRVIPADQGTYQYRRLTMALPYTPLHQDAQPDSSLVATWGKRSTATGIQVTITRLTDNQVDFNCAIPDWSSGEMISCFSVTAQRNGNICTFENDSVNGKLELGMASLWLHIESSSIEDCPVGVGLLTDILT